MKGWLFTSPDRPLELVERPDPVPGPGDVLLDVRAAGLCHSDVGFMDGTLTHLLVNLPMILGHEVAGTVLAVGEGVTGYAVGDRAVPLGPADRAPGFSSDGGYADRCLVKAVGLNRLPDSVSFVQGAAATDAGQTAYGGVMGAGAMQRGQRVGIVGLGGLGLTGARIAVINGAAEVYGVEPRREVWDKARALGVADVFAEVGELGGLDLDLIVDFAGFGTTTAGAIAAVRDGGIVSQVGLGITEAMLPVGMLVNRAVTLRGARGGRPGDLGRVLGHMAAGELAIDATTIGFDDIPAGLERLAHGRVNGRLVATFG